MATRVRTKRSKRTCTTLYGLVCLESSVVALIVRGALYQRMPVAGPHFYPDSPLFFLISFAACPAHTVLFRVASNNLPTGHGTLD